MNAREAKRTACRLIALKAETFFFHGDEGSAALPDADRKKIDAALREVIDQLFRRGKSRGKGEAP